MLPGYLAAKITTKEQNRIYVATFPKGWGRKFNEVKDIDSTTFDSVDKFMEQQKKTANKEHATKERKKKRKKKIKRKLIAAETVIAAASTRLIALQRAVQHLSVRNNLMQSRLGVN